MERTKPSAIQLGSLFGVKIGLDWSLLIVFALVFVSLGAGVLANWHPAWSPALRWGVAAGAAVLFFLSVLAHELSHAVVASWQGISVPRITLFMFGGMAHVEKEPPSPAAEFWMAIAGPITSALIGVGAWFAGSALVSRQVEAALLSQPEAAAQAMGPVATMLLWLGPVNLLLAVFNMVPGFPLDGGRVFRALAWWLSGDRLRATRWATFAGQAFGLLLVGLGLAMMFGLTVPVFGTGFASGLWLVLIGWFLRTAAQGSLQQVELRDELKAQSVADVMRGRVMTVPAGTSVAQFIEDYVFESEQRSFPVVSGTALVGMVRARAARGVPIAQREQVPIDQLMVPAHELTTLAPDTPAVETMETVARQGEVPVVRAGTLLGMLGPRDIHMRLEMRG